MSRSLNDSGHSGRQRGLTLIEMILFIVVLGVAGVVLLTSLSAPLTGAGTQTEALTAAQVAQARMEVVLGQKRKAGYPENPGDPSVCGAELDPCEADGGLPFCDATVPGGWAVDTQCEAWGSESTDCHVVAVVNVMQPDGGTHSARALLVNLGDPGCAT